MNYKKLSFGLFFSVVSTTGCFSINEIIIESPDSNLLFILNDNNGTPEYMVKYKDITFLEKSPLGLKTDIGDYSKELRFDSRPLMSEINDTYELSNIKHSKVNYIANRGIINFKKGDKHVFDLIVEVSNNDIAFQYKLLPLKETRSCVVYEEISGFNFPKGTTTFLCPQTAPMGGFARTYPSYETSYKLDDVTGHNGWGEGYTFPCLFKNGENGWILVSETGVDGSYCASRLLNKKDELYIMGFPQAGECNGLGSVTPGITLPGVTPWRTITIGESLKPIVETTVMFDVVKPLYDAKYDYQYTKGTWSWIIGMDYSMNYNEQKRYIDFSADMGYETVLVDALWDVNLGYDKLEELAKYAASKDVYLYLWYNSNGYWNDAPQTPKNKMNTSAERRKEMAWMQKIGIKGIKVDFFGGDKQNMMQIYQDILTDANDFGLMVIFHGCTLPRGWERMFPNYASSEAVLASENLSFSQNSCNNEALNATIHPFIRNTVGNMDFGGSALNKFYNSQNIEKGSKRVTSDVYAIATAVLFQSCVQHFALAPNNINDAPQWAIEFMKNVPTTWDKTRYIDGYPGKYVVLARRKGDKWYIAGVNAQDEPVNVDIEFDLGNNITVYSDNKLLNGTCKKIKANKNNKLKVFIPKNGGIVMMN